MDANAALAHWTLAGPARPAEDAGLINHTWLVGQPVQGVLQWVNPIFKPTVHLDIEAVTARLASQGLLTPRLVPTRAGALWVEDEAGCWRVLSYVPGRTLHRIDGPATAAEAGALVGCFHAALAGWEYRFQHVRAGAHDTPAHMARLREALEAADGHPLAGPARELGGRVLAAWQTWDGALDLPEHACHGDLKISNLRFDADGARALCLLDLDTLSSLSYAVEMGDAWRSWCNRAGEDHPDAAALDLDVFEASARAWLSTAPPLEDRERQGLVAGIERICLELSARFCGDAVRNTYFREDRARFPVAGAHNLHRALGQLRLAESARARRSICEGIVRNAGRPRAAAG